ncbi:MAG: glycosyltransferase family 4 protein, partial [Burkholderiaceae bacterium]
MRKIFIDITRLIGRGLKERLPTGIDRVSLEYIRYFSHEARGVVRLGGRTVLLSHAASARMFAELLNPTPRFRGTALQLIARAHLTSLGNAVFKDAVLFNTGHSGLEHHGYARQLRKLQVKPMVLVHDLIPITHPE